MDFSLFSYLLTFEWYFEVQEHQHRAQHEKYPQGLSLRSFGWMEGLNSPGERLKLRGRTLPEGGLGPPPLSPCFALLHRR